MLEGFQEERKPSKVTRSNVKRRNAGKKPATEEPATGTRGILKGQEQKKRASQGRERGITESKAK
jgi:hypothetical protein